MVQNLDKLVVGLPEGKKLSLSTNILHIKPIPSTLIKSTHKKEPQVQWTEEILYPVKDTPKQTTDSPFLGNTKRKTREVWSERESQKYVKRNSKGSLDH